MTSPNSLNTDPNSQPPQSPQREEEWVSLKPLSEIPVGGHSTTRIDGDVVDHEIYNSAGELIDQKRTDIDGNEIPVGIDWFALPSLGELGPRDQERNDGLLRRFLDIIRSSRRK